MREVVTIQVGQCGNQFGVDFWEKIVAEHGIDTSGSVVDEGLFDAGDHTVLFKELPDYHHSSSSSSSLPHLSSHSLGHLPLPRRLIPRCVLVDTEPGTLQSIRAGRSGSLFSPDDLVFTQGGAGNNWAKGHLTLGAELVDCVLDRVRKHAEESDSLQALQLLHSLGGGTGSGLGTLILSRLREEYPDRLTCTYSVIPSAKVSDSVVEPYNTTLSMQLLIEQASQCFTFDNEALYDIAQRALGSGMHGDGMETTAMHSSYGIHSDRTPTFKDLNTLMASAMSGTTCCVRYPGPLNCDYRKLAVNLVPFPRLHFYMIAQAPLPLTSYERERYRSLDAHDVISQLWDAHNLMCGADPRRGKYLTCGCLFRGDERLSLLEIARELGVRTQRESPLFSEWIPNRLAVALSVTHSLPHAAYLSPQSTHSSHTTFAHTHRDTVPPHISATLVANNTAIQELWRRVLSQFSSMLRRRAFLHWYTGEGLEETQFAESELNLRDLVAEYQQYEEMSAEDESEAYKEMIEAGNKSNEQEDYEWNEILEA